MKKIFYLVSTILAILCSNITHSQTGWQWVRSATDSNTISAGACVTTDLLGNVYVAGSFGSDSIAFDTCLLHHSGIHNENNVFVVKYNSNGGALWARTINTRISNYASAVVTDKFGDVYVAGINNDTDTYYVYDSMINSYAFLIKYDSSGNVLLVDSFYELSSDPYFVWSPSPPALSCDTFGNLYFGAPDSLRKFDSSGQIIWTSSVASSYGRMVSDPSGNVYISSYLPVFYSIDSVILRDSLGNILLLKIDSSGHIVWATKTGVGAIYSGYNISIAVDDLDRVCMTGNFTSDSVTFGSTTLYNSSSSYPYGNTFLTKFDSSGNVLWAKESTCDGQVSASSIAIDLYFNVYVAGDFFSEYLFFDSAASLPGGQGKYIVKFDSTGSALWLKNSTGESPTLPIGANICIDTFGNLYLAGTFTGAPSIVFDTLYPPFSTGENAWNNMFVAKNDNESLTVKANPGDTVCVGTSVTFAATASYYPNFTPYYQWSVNGTDVGTDSAGFTTDSLLPGNDTVLCKLINVNTGAILCFNYVVIIVDSTVPTSVIDGPNNVCLREVVILSDSTSGGFWSESNSNGFLYGYGGNWTDVTGINEGLDTITYFVSNACGSSVFNKIISIDSVPEIPSGSTSICQGSSTLLTDGTPGGTWSSSAPSIATISDSGFVTGIMAGSVYISYTNSMTGCLSRIGFNVNPVVGAYEIYGIDSVCVGVTTTIFNSSHDFPVVSWRNYDSSIASLSIIFGSVSSAASITALSAGMDTFYSTQENSCGSYTAKKAIKILPLPSAGTITSTANLCYGTPLTLTDSGTVGTPSWNSIDTSIASVAGDIITGLSLGTDSVVYTVANGCGVVSTGFVITVNPLPAAGSVVGEDSVCPGATISLYDTGSIGVGAWGVSNANASESGGLITGISEGIDTVNYTATNICGIVVASKAIFIKPLPDAGNIICPDTLCVGATDTLTSTVAGGVWINTDWYSSLSGSSLSGSGQGLDTIKYTYTNSCGNAATTKIVYVLAMPNAGVITGITDTVCSTGYPPITLHDTVSGGVWSSMDYMATVSDSVITGAYPGADVIIYKVTNRCGSDSATYAIYVLGSPELPTITLASANLCQGDSERITTYPTDGYWVGYNPYATITQAGFVKGKAAGTEIISYILTNPCSMSFNTISLTINPLAFAGNITGKDSLCVGNNTMLNDTAGMPGFWISANSGLATLSAGMVTAVSTGTDTIFYAVSNQCGADTARFVLYVGTLPNKPTISGNTYVCIGSHLNTFSANMTGGNWGLTNNNATGSNGFVGGLTPGKDTLFYELTNFCGSARDSMSIDVYSTWECDSINVVQPINKAGGYFHIYPNPNTGDFSIDFPDQGKIDLIITDVNGQIVETQILERQNVEPIQISIGNAATGIYFVRVSTDKNMYIGKILTE